MVKNKKGWMRILEAFIAVSLIAGVLIIILNQQNVLSNKTSVIPNYEIFIIRSIELNDTLRAEIVNMGNSSLPSNWYNSTFPSDVKNIINFLTPSSITCQAQICNTTDTCNFFQTNINKDIYAQNVLITSTLQTYNPRQLKLYCWSAQ